MQWGAIPVAVPRSVNTKPNVHAPFTGSARWGTVAVLVAAVLFGSTGTARELGPDRATTLAVGAVRLTVGAGVLGLAVAIARRSWRGLDRRLVALGGAAVAAYQVTFFTGTQRTGVTLGTITALAAGPVVAGIIAASITRRPPSARWLASTSLAIVGVALALAASGSVRLDPLGTVAALGAGASYAVYATTVGRLIAGGGDALASMAGTFLVGGALVAPLLFTEPLDWVATPSGAALSVHLGVGTVAVAYALYAIGLTTLSVPTAVTLTLAEPVTAAVLGRFVLDEPVSWIGWIGMGLVAAALLMVGRSQGER